MRVINDSTKRSKLKMESLCVEVRWGGAFEMSRSSHTCSSHHPSQLQPVPWPSLPPPESSDARCGASLLGLL